MSWQCHARGCRYPRTHLTCAHKCGICGMFGHGQLECNKLYEIEELANIAEDIDHYSCTVPGCKQPWSHMNEAHHCLSCGKRGGCDCRNSAGIITKTCPSCKVISNIDTKYELFTGGECIVCLQFTKMVVFEKCHHANVCSSCIQKL